LHVNPSGSNNIIRGLSVLNLRTSNNTGYGVTVLARQDGALAQSEFRVVTEQNRRRINLASGTLRA